MTSISSRMISALSALFFCTAVLASIAFITQARQSLAFQEVYEHSVERVRQVEQLGALYSNDILQTTLQARSGDIPFVAALGRVQAAMEKGDSLWAHIPRDDTDPRERQLMAQSGALLAQARDASAAVAQSLRRNEQTTLNILATERLEPVIADLARGFSALIEYHRMEGKTAIDRAIRVGKGAQITLPILAFLAVALCVISIEFLLGSVIEPLMTFIGTMRALAAHTMGSAEPAEVRLARLQAIRIEGAQRPDEIGEMARTLETFKEAGIERQRLRASADSEQAARIERAQRIELIVTEFESAAQAIIGSVVTASSELEASAKSMMNVARTASEQSTLVAAASQEASTSIQSLAATGDELAMSICEIGRQAEQSSHFAAKAAEKARSTDVTVARLNEAGHAIVEVVDLIKSIASQTNLLALNATIEAARAGETGKGFAVVAQEVKNLAAQTSRATDVIAEHVGQIQSASEESISAMREIGTMIEDINHVASSIASSVTEQTQATQGIAEHVMQVSEGSSSAAHSMNIVNESAASTGAAASQVLGASAELSRQSALMRAKVDDFLHAVRAA